MRVIQLSHFQLQLKNVICSIYIRLIFDRVKVQAGDLHTWLYREQAVMSQSKRNVKHIKHYHKHTHKYK